MGEKEIRSRITDGPADPIFTARVLGRYDVRYFRCRRTGFIQTETPYWLQEAYSDAITALDLGLLSRNLKARRFTAMFIDRFLSQEGAFVDFGGGYGIFTRLMRDWGFDYWQYDPICENLFAKQFEISLPTEKKQPFEVVTAWELFEHLTDPMDAIETMFTLSDTVLFSTELVPDDDIRSVDDWWYFIPETGQHVSFYTESSLRLIASKFGATFFSDGSSVHLFTKRSDISNPFSRREVRLLREAIFQFKRRLRGSKGLLKNDLDAVRKLLNREQANSARNDSGA